RKTRWWLTPAILLASIILLHLCAMRGGWVEKIYSTRIYPLISSVLRMATGWLPFSVGDILYVAAIVWLLYKIIQFFGRSPSWRKLFIELRALVVKALWVYLVFL